jgi:single-strand DNA-binding protein
VIVSVSGNLCADPRLQWTPGKIPTADFRIAENRFSKDRSGEWRTETSFFDVVCWRSLAVNAAESLHRGDRVVVVGRLRQEQWTTDLGDMRTRYLIEASDLASSLCFAKVAVTSSHQTDELSGPQQRAGAEVPADV